jgi:hypothetical protein
VPATHGTIAAALADASCTTIQIAAGTYPENLIVGRSVTIEGAGQAATIVDGGGNGRVIDVGPGLTVHIRDLTVRNGRLAWDNGAGIRNGSVSSPQPAQGSNLTLTRVTVRDNDAGDGFGGGIMNNRYSTLVVEHSTVAANRARDGGGVGVVIDSTVTIDDSVIGGATQADGNIAGNSSYGGFGGGINNTDGVLHVNRSVIRNNRTTGPYGPGPGGGICNDTTNGTSVTTITDSTIADNYANYGGGIAGDGFRGSLTISGSTLTGNTSDAYFANGGAIWLYNGNSLTMSNSTISGNVARGVSSATGGGIGTIALYNSTYDAYVTLTNVTITDNLAWGIGNSYVTSPGAAGGGIGRQSGVKFRMLNTIVSGNRTKTLENAAVDSDCSGAELHSLGHNLFGQDGDANGCPAGNGTDVIPPAGTMTADIIGALGDNGGSTLTHGPVPGGLAIDAGDDAVSLTTDQIGSARQFGAHVDIGSVELIGNTAPTADAGGPYSVSEGGSVTLAGSGSDADQDAASLDYSWDLDNDGVFETTGQSAAFSAAALDGPSSVTVNLRVCDDAGACDDASVTVSILNAAPSATAQGDTIGEGGTATVSGTIADPGSLDTHTVVIDWGGSATTLNLAPGVLTYSASQAFADDAVQTVTVTVSDDDGGTGSATAVVTVSNAAPAVTVSGSSNASANQPYSLSGTYSDAGALDTHTATINWGDGTVETMSVSGGVFGASHQYSAAGSYTVTACVTDDDGGSGCASLELTVTSSAGKVTGGGLRTANNGRGGFNVMSNGNAISGELQFQSALGKFHAHVFTSLAVSADGRSAWFSGVGRDGRAFTAYVEDNGEPGRNDVFRLWIDGVPQNGSGAMNGGNIQIHR